MPTSHDYLDVPADHPCPLCPACGSHRIVWLEASSRGMHVHYCRCDVCAHIFSVTRDEHRQIRDVTERHAPGDPATKKET